MEQKIKLVTLEDVLQEVCNPNEDIAITVITPSQIVHAIPLDPEINRHTKLLHVVSQEIFPQSKRAIQEFDLISIHYNYIDRQTIIYAPGYLTSKQSEALFEVLPRIKNAGFKIGMILSDIEPINHERIEGLEELHIELEVFDELDDPATYIGQILAQGRLVEYELPFGEERRLTPDQDFQKTN